jgi:hypothetical protein
LAEDSREALDEGVSVARQEAVRAIEDLPHHRVIDTQIVVGF